GLPGARGAAVAGAQEVSLQRLQGAAGGDRARGGDELRADLRAVAGSFARRRPTRARAAAGNRRAHALRGAGLFLVLGGQPGARRRHRQERRARGSALTFTGFWLSCCDSTKTAWSGDDASSGRWRLPRRARLPSRSRPTPGTA